MIRFCSALDDSLGADEPPICLVLDDVHEVGSPVTLGQLSLLIRRMPDQCRMLLVSRAAPALPIPRLRLDDRLVEVKARDLIFDREVTASLLGTHGVKLTRLQLDKLLERTEGWPAALRLAAMTIAESTTRRGPSIPLRGRLRSSPIISPAKSFHTWNRRLWT